MLAQCSNSNMNVIQVGAAFMSHSLTLPDGKNVKFEIW